ARRVRGLRAWRSQQANILEETCRDHAHVEVGEADREETQPREKHMAFVQTAEQSPGGVAGRAEFRAGEAIELASRQMAQGVAREGVESEQQDIYQQDE